MSAIRLPIQMVSDGEQQVRSMIILSTLVGALALLRRPTLVQGIVRLAQYGNFLCTR